MQILHFLRRWESFFSFYVFDGHRSFFRVTGNPVLDFWWRLLWVLTPEWVPPYSLFAEVNIMYIPWDAPLVLHVPTSWRPARSQSLPHMHVQRWDLAQIWTGNHPGRTHYPCASNPARWWDSVLRMMLSFRGILKKRNYKVVWDIHLSYLIM